ncbi:MAG: glutaminyl-peptide cyclotransferase, partial [Pseudomonadota bacterium]|nr:glutaminyl-peptide cyclotransferase [Pseudomonadota bacterium]
VFGENQVANGIAWDAQRRRLFVTGKEWPLLFEIAPPRRKH